MALTSLEKSRIQAVMLQDQGTKSSFEQVLVQPRLEQEAWSQNAFTLSINGHG